uniref:NUDE_C domain-containing protein n=1 Tax=Syphacia muris TaxID=451379 RepID=A0A0N5AWR8_9BILA
MMETFVSGYQDEANRYKKEAEEARAELEEFILCSKTMEAELDEELNSEKRKSSKMEREIMNLRTQLEKYKDDLSRYRAESCAVDSKKNDELKSLRAENESLSKRVRKLEQENDDLERELRIKNETLKDTEKRLNDELELRALLSTELDAKEELGEHCQRLEDEIRDLKLDNSVKDAKIRNWRTIERNALSSHPDDIKAYHNSVLKSSMKQKVNGDMESVVHGSNCNPLASPLTRNITPVIANLLKTVQGLEKKLLSMHPERNAPCENCLSPLNRC